MKLFDKLLHDDIAASLISFLVFWYTNQTAFVRRHDISSASFSVGNGTRQGSILSPYLFTRYLRELIASMVQCAIGCNVGGTYVNILAYADDIVLLAPSWKGLQHLNTFSQAGQSIDMQCNVNKTVCMSYAPKNRSKIVSHSFPDFTLDGMKLKLVSSFRYLDHIV